MRLTSQTARELLFEALLFGAGAGEIALLYERPVLLTALMLATGVLAIAFWRKRHALPFYVVGAVIGPAGEILCVQAGAFGYSHPTFLGIPLWLPFAWGLVTVLITGIAGTFARNGHRNTPKHTGGSE